MSASNFAEVDQEEVIRYWLRSEYAKYSEDPPRLQRMDGDGLARSLEKYHKKHKGSKGPTTIFRKRNLNWYTGSLSKAELQSLRVVIGPDSDKGWRGLSPDSTVNGAARRIHKSNDLGRLGDEVDVDTEYISNIADEFDKDPPEKIILAVTGETIWPWVVDGNHRAAAGCLRLWRSEPYVHQDAYIGVEKPRKKGLLSIFR